MNKALFKTKYLNPSNDDKGSESKSQILKLYRQACRQHQQATKGLFFVEQPSTANSVQCLISSKYPVVG